MSAGATCDTQATDLQQKLDHFYLVVKDQLLKYQHPISGLFPLNPKDPNCKISHIRDSIYCATALWALHRCFARIDDEKGRHYELGQCAVKCMRAILIGWMQQSSRLEQFKRAQNTDTCLHPRLDYETGEPIYDDHYPNIQMDCVGLFVIQLAQMIKSGLQVVYTRDEVAFMQHLVFYVERAYRIPDFGMWERGTKQNRNMVELNASSIGMAMAALEAVSGLNVYGAEGSHSSTLVVDIDAHSRNRIILANLLPRESASKGSDASLVPTLCWPAYGASDSAPRGPALERCLVRLKGQYGFRRFTRDGYATVLDHNTVYQPGEIMKFSGIESEWPMFFAYMIIEHCMNAELDKAMEYDNLLQPLMVNPVSEAHPWLPKFFYVPLEDLDAERKQRGSVLRKSSFRLPGASYFLWGQAVYIISQLLVSGCMSPSDLDPLARCPAWRKFTGSLPLTNSNLVHGPLNLTIQVVIISESTRLQQLLATYGIITQTPLQVEPIQIWPPDQLVRVGKFMGCSENLGLSGRPQRPVGQLGLSRFYRISGLTVLCYPLLFEAQDFYLLHDIKVVIDEIKTDFRFLSEWWRFRGRPTFCILLREDMVKVPGFDQLVRFLVSMKNGTVHGTRIVLGRAQKFVSSGCVEHLDFLPLWTATGDYFHRLRDLDTGNSFRSLDDLPKAALSSTTRSLQFSSAVPPVNELLHLVHTMDRCRYEDFPDDRLLKLVQESADTPLDLANKVALIHELHRRHGFDFVIHSPEQTQTVKECLLDLSRKAGIMQIWCVVRLCAAILSQFVNSLAPSLSIILVCGKQVTIGVAQGNEVVVSRPQNPDQLYKLLREAVHPYDPVQFSLQQELILWVSSLLTSDKELFNGIKLIRLGWLVEAMKLQLEFEAMQESSGDPTSLDHAGETGLSMTKVSPDNHRSLGACRLYNLPPCMVKDLLLRTLKTSQAAGSDGAAKAAKTSEPSVPRSRQRRLRMRRDVGGEERPSAEAATTPNTGAGSNQSVLFYRQLDGCLGRVPATFYQSLYSILERSPHGVLICNKLLPQKPTLTDMTPYDLNFVDEVEFLLRPIGDPAYRSLLVETVMVIGVILERNKELSFKDTVDIKMFIQDAMNAFAHDKYGKDVEALPAPESRASVRRPSWPDPLQTPDLRVYSEFAATQANAPMGTTGYLAKAALDRLLHGVIDLSKIHKDTCAIM